MGKVFTSMSVSLDGYIEDPEGSIAFSAPDEEVHRLANQNAREAAVFLFGRRLYEIMEGPWREIAARPDVTEVEAEFAKVYFDTPRIVFSDSLDEVPDGVRLVRRKDAYAEVARLRAETDGVLDLGGAELAASVIDLIDEFRLFVVPVALGGGKPYFPAGRRLDLRLVEQRVFESGTVYLCYERAG